MKRGEIYRVGIKLPERGKKPGYYVVVSRHFIANAREISTVVCAPVYSSVLGVSTEVLVGPKEGLERTSAIRCDFLTLMFKEKLERKVGVLVGSNLKALDRALSVALGIGETT